MLRHRVTRTLNATLLALVGWTIACAGTSPTRPTPGTPGTPAATAAAPPTVAVISPSTGSTGGDTRTQVTGTGFQTGTTVSFGEMTVPGRFDSRWKDGTRIYLDTPEHTVGTVDVIVRNPDGQSALLSAAYTYVAPDTFDFNGDWTGFGNAGQDIPLGFTIRDNAVISVTCDTFATLTFSPPLAVQHGAFAVLRDGGIAVSGRIVSASTAVGTMNLTPCSDTVWSAVRR